MMAMSSLVPWKRSGPLQTGQGHLGCITTIFSVVYIIVAGFACCVNSSVSTFGSETPGEIKSYKGHHLVRFIPVDESHLHLLKQLQAQHEDEAEFWLNHDRPQKPVDMRLSQEAAKYILPLANKSGLPFDVMTNDIEELMVHQRSRRSVPDTLLNALDNSSMSEAEVPFSLTEYHPYNEIESWLESIEENCDHCELIDIGDTYEGRPMRVLKIGSGSPNKPVVWIDAGIHAREWIAPATALYVISKLAGNDKVARNLVNKYTWYILPVANPDGYVHTWTTDRLWRKTRSMPTYINTDCRGVDPNRNWDFHWAGPGTSDNPCNENYHGHVPFSEPETQNIASALMSLQDNMAVYLSLHSYGQYWLTPWGYTRNYPADYLDMVRMGTKAANSMRRNRGNSYQVGSSSELLYLAAGGSDDWVKAILGVKYAYTVELTDTGRHGFLLPPQYIDQTSKEMMAAIKSLALGVQRERRRAARRQRLSVRARA